MKQFKLINDKLVQVQNDKEMPDATRYETDNDYCDALDKYYDSLPSYSLSEEMKEWIEKNPKDSYPESDFKLMYERFIDGMNKWVKCEKVEYDAISWQLHKTHRRIVAVPATDEKDEQDERDIVKMVYDWHKRFGVDIGGQPSLIEFERFGMRQNILKEEVKELDEAYEKCDIIEVADALCDIMYVAIGTVIEFGLHEKFYELFKEVHRSNMSKLDENGKPVKREDGKILKSSLFTPPNLKKIIESKYHLSRISKND